MPANFGELAELQARQVPLVKRARALGLLSRQHPTLAVAGTHGKTTTSTLATYLLQELGLEPVAFMGGISANYDTNYLPGAAGWMVVEADEYDRSFLQLSPQVAIVTFIEPDHLDIYGEAASCSSRSGWVTAALISSSPVTTVTEIGTSCSRSARRCAVMTMSLVTCVEGDAVSCTSSASRSAGGVAVCAKAGIAPKSETAVVRSAERRVNLCMNLSSPFAHDKTPMLQAQSMAQRYFLG